MKTDFMPQFPLFIVCYNHIDFDVGNMTSESEKLFAISEIPFAIKLLYCTNMQETVS